MGPVLPASVLLLLVAACTGCTGPGAANAQADGLQVGDSWTMRFEGADGKDWGEPALSVKMTVVARSEHGGFDAFEVRIEEQSEDPADYETVSTSWLRASDLATIETTSTDMGRSSEYQSRHEYREPCPDAMAGPLVVGRTWQVTCERRYTSNEDPSLTTGSWGNDTKTYTVEARERITVGAGTFDTFRVRVADPDFEDSSDGATIHWIAPGVCAGIIKVDTHEGATIELEQADC